MRKIIFILCICIAFQSCVVVYGGPNIEKRAKKLELGMSKQEAIKIMENDYFIELSSQTADETIEVLHFSSISYHEYLLHFANGKLFEFHKYTAPQKIHVVKEEIH